MVIIFVNNPMQDANTLEPQLIDGRVVYWTVVSECMKSNETFKEWLVRKEERINTHPNYSSIEGLLIYDMQPIVSTPYEGVTHGGMIIRYAFLKKKEENI
jgi:hypothetical protein